MNNSQYCCLSVSKKKRKKINKDKSEKGKCVGDTLSSSIFSGVLILNFMNEHASEGKLPLLLLQALRLK